MKRLIILVLWVVCMLALLVGCSSQENEIGDIDNHTPIALLDDAVVYNYIDDDGALVIGRYVFPQKAIRYRGCGRVLYFKWKTYSD